MQSETQQADGEVAVSSVWIVQWGEEFEPYDGLAVEPTKAAAIDRIRDEVESMYEDHYKDAPNRVKVLDGETYKNCPALKVRGHTTPRGTSIVAFRKPVGGDLDDLLGDAANAVGSLRGEADELEARDDVDDHLTDVADGLRLNADTLEERLEALGYRV